MDAGARVRAATLLSISTTMEIASRAIVGGQFGPSRLRIVEAIVEQEEKFYKSPPVGARLSDWRYVR
jgi:hypothetical protein